MLQNNGKRPFFMAPASAFALLVLLTFLGFFVGEGGGASLRASIYIILAYGASFLLFGRELGRMFRKNGQVFSKKLWLLIGLTLLSLIFCSGALEYGMSEGRFDAETVYIYGFALPRREGIVGLLFAGVILPALGEEMLFRGMLFRVYGKAGALGQILLPALLGAMMTGRFEMLPMGFVMGVLLGLLRLATGHIWAGALVHLGYRLYVLFGGEVMWRLTFSSEARVLFTCLTVFLAGLSLTFFFHIASEFAAFRTDGELPVAIPKNRRADALWDVLFSPPLWFAVLLFLVAAVLLVGLVILSIIFASRSRISQLQDANLEFWLGHRVEAGDFAGHEQYFGTFGEDIYLGEDYAFLRDAHGGQRFPAHYVSYTVKSYPDAAFGKQTVTSVHVTDPEVTMWGISVNSTAEEVDEILRSHGFRKDGEVYKRGRLLFSHDGASFGFGLRTTNILGVIY